MLDFVNRSRDKEKHSLRTPPEIDTEIASLKAQKQALRIEESTLRDQRRQVREMRRQEDIVWKMLKEERRTQVLERTHYSRPKREQQEEIWRVIRTSRRQQVAERKIEDEQWRKRRLSLREQWDQLPVVTSWIAILIVTDDTVK